MTHSRLLWDKGIAEVVEAARILTSEGHAFRWLLVGDVDPHNPRSLTQEDVAAIRASGARTQVELLGRREDIAELLHTADIACLPSYREGLPLSLAEGAACGLAIVTTDVPGCREMTDGGACGVAVAPRDGSALAAGLAPLLADRATRLRMGDAARAFAERELSSEVVNSRTLSLYERVRGNS